MGPHPRGACRKPSAEPHPCCERGPYRVDENTERRNHYLDLAGIENYTSKFGPGKSWGLACTQAARPWVQTPQEQEPSPTPRPSVVGAL